MLAYAATIFSGAFLLFQVQPLMGKFILPWFGGSPAVWTTCMLFFQFLLLGGYGYAHWLTTWVKPQKQAMVHCFFLAASIAFLPIIPGDQWKPDPGVDPTGHILLLLLVTIGMPYFVLSSTGPLIQKWFSWLYPTKSPYPLYALSNVGSLLALLSYPFLFEPQLSRTQQSAVWTLGLFAFVACCGWCTWKLWKWGKGIETPVKNLEEAEGAPLAPTPLWHHVLWLLLPACASALLLATTNKLCQDVAVVPFLWVVPLSVYLLTFILSFLDWKIYWRRIFLPLFVVSAVWVTWTTEDVDDVAIGWQIASFMLALFASCMLCHGELYRLRPHPRRLTRFYLMVSLGGALGGLFVAVGAPALFLDYVEFYWMLALTALLAWMVCKPRFNSESFAPWKFKAWLCGLLTVIMMCIHLHRSAYDSEETDRIVERVRNFYGTLKVVEYEDADDVYRQLNHGRITHGLQIMDEGEQDITTTYYGEQSGVGHAMFFTAKTPVRKIALVGLGTGTLASYGRATDTFRFYEINPDVVRIAKEHFTFLKRTAAKVEIVMGDARLSMEREPPQNYDIIALDAFSSDAIPVHLLTREAFEIYLKHLKEDGYLAIHISNLFLDLEPVVKNAAKEFGLHHVTVWDENQEDNWYTYRSTWMVLSRNKIFVEVVRKVMLAADIEESDRKVELWTDDYTSLYPILIGVSDDEYEFEPESEENDLEQVDSLINNIEDQMKEIEEDIEKIEKKPKE